MRMLQAACYIFTACNLWAIRYTSDCEPFIDRMPMRQS